MLGVVSDPPELGPADRSIALRALTVDGAEGDAGRARAGRWFLCDPLVTDDPARCARDPSMHSVAGDGDSLTLAREALTSRGARTALFALCLGRAAAYDSARGAIACPDEAGVAYPRTEGVVAFKTVRAAAAGATANQHPAIESARFDGAQSGARWTIARCRTTPCASAEVLVTPSEASAERLTDRREALTVSFFATDGSFDRPRAVTVEGSDGRDGSLRAAWTPPNRAGSVRVWLVLRDDRGGISLLERAIDVAD